MADIYRSDEVLIVYGDHARNHYVSVTGRARILTDRMVLRSSDRGLLSGAGFRTGSRTSILVALRVDVEHAEYWDRETRLMVLVYSYAKAPSPATGPTSRARRGTWSTRRGFGGSALAPGRELEREFHPPTSKIEPAGARYVLMKRSPATLAADVTPVTVKTDVLLEPVFEMGSIGHDLDQISRHVGAVEAGRQRRRRRAVGDDRAGDDVEGLECAV